MAHDVFISHSVKNKEVADAMCEALEGAGIKCWIAPRDVPAGGNYAAEITRGIRSTKFVVFIFSEPSNQSDAVQKELERAFNNRKTIIPFRIEDVQASDAVDYLIAASQWIDAVQPPLEEHFQALIAAIQGAPGKPVRKTSPAKPRKPLFTKRRALVLGGILAAAGLAIGGTIAYRAQQRAVSVQLVSPLNKAFTIGNDKEGSLILRYQLPEKLNRKAELELQGADGAIRKATTSGNSYLVSGHEGSLRWRIRASWSAASGAIETGPWSDWNEVTFYSNRLNKILQTRQCVIGTADLSPDDMMVNFDPATNRPGGYEVELLSRFLQSEATERGISAPVEIAYKPANQGWGDTFFHMLQHDPSVDMLVSGVTPTAARETSWGVKFSSPSMTFSGALLIRKGEAGLNGGEILPKIIGAADNTTNKDFLVQLFGLPHPRVYVDPGPKAYDSLIQRLLSESIDAILIDEIYIPTLLKQHPGLKEKTDVVPLSPSANPAFIESSAAYVLRPEDSDFRRELDRFLVKETALRQELKERFIGKP